MEQSRRLCILVAILIGGAIFLWLGTALQRTTTDLFASPDETAVNLFARTWVMGDGFRLSHGLPLDMMDLAGLHPRSVVRQAESLVPVGFLGMPIIIGLVEKIAGGLGAFATPVLTLSSAIPLYLLARRRSRRIAILSVLFYLSFPIVILYSNRALFPNLPVVALALWSIWAWKKIGRTRLDGDEIKRMFGIWNLEFGISLIAGLSTGLALIIRPVEAVWFVPWIVWAWMGQEGERMRDEGGGMPRRRPLMSLFIAGVTMILVLAMGWIVARQTYGASHGLFPVGYHIRDDAGAGVSATVTSASSGSSVLLRFLPFGIHPRTLWANVRAYMGTAFGLWYGLAMAGIAIDVKRRTLLNRNAMIVCGLAVWTIFVLLLLYGQSAYTDNINGGVTIGNSFLRYLLPLAPLVAFGCAIAVDRLFNLPRRRGIIAGPFAVSLLVILGIVTALARDDEGILRTRYELMRYQSIRVATERMVPWGSIILSERSDKIFASGHFIVASPIPDAATLGRIRASGWPAAYYFTRTLDAKMDADPVVAAFDDVTPVFTLQNETMYKLESSFSNKKTIQQYNNNNER